MSDLTALPKALYQGDAEAVAELTQQALDANASPEDILADGLMAGMNAVGADFRSGALYIPEVLLAAQAMKAGMAILRPLLAGDGVVVGPKVVLGTVQGDLHDIGKNLVGMMLEGAGFEVVDLGVDITPDKFAEAVKQEKPDVVGISALLTTSMTMMPPTMQAIQEAGLRDTVKIIVGGAPVTPAYAETIGADGYASNAAGAVDLAKELTGAA